MQIFILPLTNAIEVLKSEFLAYPGIIRQESADSFADFMGKIKFVPQLFTFFIKNYFTMLKFSNESF